ncbi:reverse transcriptase domain-containing protein [Microbispora rosea]|uniref:reverse transcriptase domain-containing protein n=1 Tax=Microbispora rosea TaxID=58117 RepID=UPI00341FB72F
MKYLTIEEAAKELNLSSVAVRRLASQGKIKATQHDGRWLVDPDDVTNHRLRRYDRSADQSPAPDFTLALQHVEATDLNEAWVPDVLCFKDYLLDRGSLLARAADRLSAYPDPVISVEVAKTPFFTRSAALLTLEDRIAFQAAVATIAPKVEALLADSVYSARLSQNNRWFLKRGVTQWLEWKKRVRQELTADCSWMIKSDLTGYFDNIPHDLLMQDISFLDPRPEVTDGIRRMLSMWSDVPGKGIPQGPNASRVLGNLYLAPVDKVLLGAGYKYFRYMDDIRIVGKTKAEVTAGMRLFEHECRKRGLIASSAKTKLLEGEEALEDGRNQDRDTAQYFYDRGNLPRARRELKQILRRSLSDDGHIDDSAVKFSLWRLARIREETVLDITLDRLEDLAPVSTVVAAFLKYFIDRPRTVQGIADFFSDKTRSHSSFLVTWLFAAMWEHCGPLPSPWTEYARRYLQDRNHPAYLRAIAAPLVARSGLASDITWIRQEIRREFNPMLLRGFALGLWWSENISAIDEQVLRSKSPILEQTLNYLKDRNSVQSLIYPAVALSME